MSRGLHTSTANERTAVCAARFLQMTFSRCCRTPESDMIGISSLKQCAFSVNLLGPCVPQKCPPRDHENHLLCFCSTLLLLTVPTVAFLSFFIDSLPSSTFICFAYIYFLHFSPEIVQLKMSAFLRASKKLTFHYPTGSLLNSSSQKSPSALSSTSQSLCPSSMPVPSHVLHRNNILQV